MRSAVSLLLAVPIILLCSSPMIGTALSGTTATMSPAGQDCPGPVKLPHDAVDAEEEDGEGETLRAPIALVDVSSSHPPNTRGAHASPSEVNAASDTELDSHPARGPPAS